MKRKGIQALFASIFLLLCLACFSFKKKAIFDCKLNRCDVKLKETRYCYTNYNEWHDWPNAIISAKVFTDTVPVGGGH
jgi:hypothetical protein